MSLYNLGFSLLSDELSSCYWKCNVFVYIIIDTQQYLGSYLHHGAFKS